MRSSYTATTTNGKAGSQRRARENAEKEGSDGPKPKKTKAKANDTEDEENDKNDDNNNDDDDDDIDGDDNVDPLAVPLPSGFRILRNFGGVQGLSIAYEVFTEAAEKAFFEAPGLFAPLQPKTVRTAGRYHENIMGPQSFPREMFELLNAARDCGLKSGLITPDYCLAWGYPQGSKFAAHFDSRYRWGEDVMGVSLGTSCEIHFIPVSRVLPAGSKTVKAVLPRRSIYIMEDEARTLWKHGIFKVGKAVGARGDIPPAWNPDNYRRSLTLRCTKTYNAFELERQIAARKSIQSSSSSAPSFHKEIILMLQQRLSAQRVFGEEKNQEGKKFSKEEMAAVEATARNTLKFVLELPESLSQARLPRGECNFLEHLPPVLSTKYKSEPRPPSRAQRGQTLLGEMNTGVFGGFGGEGGGGGGGYGYGGAGGGGGAAGGGAGGGGGFDLGALFQSYFGGLGHILEGGGGGSGGANDGGYGINDDEEDNRAIEAALEASAGDEEWRFQEALKSSITDRGGEKKNMSSSSSSSAKQSSSSSSSSTIQSSSSSKLKKPSPSLSSSSAIVPLSSKPSDDELRRLRMQHFDKRLRMQHFDKGATSNPSAVANKPSAIKPVAIKPDPADICIDLTLEEEED